MLRKKGFDSSVNIAKKFGLERVFGRKNSLPNMSSNTRAWLNDLFSPDIERLRKLLGDDIPEWRI